MVRNMLSQAAYDVALSPSSTSYFSAGEDHLDPTLFEGNHLRPWVRTWVIRTVHTILGRDMMHPDSWSRIWISGSGVSYQWSANREPADLDLMVGINYVDFRRANPAYAGFTDGEIASSLNEHMYRELQGPMGEFPADGSDYEVTAYVNRGVTAAPDSISAINPYAAYDVTSDEWSVVPQRAEGKINPAWEMGAERDRQYAEDLVREYGKALQEIQGAQNHAHRTNAESRLHQLMDQAAGLYDELHSGRRAAFGFSGGGYSDYHNYRWQAGKRNGVVQAMKKVRAYLNDAQDKSTFETYGVELPDTDTLIRRSMGHRR
jgi:hypothetical protein